MKKGIIIIATAVLLSLAASFGERQAKTTIEDAFLIVPGQRVGAFVLNQKYDPDKALSVGSGFSQESYKRETQIYRGDSWKLWFTRLMDENLRPIDNSVGKHIWINDELFRTAENLGHHSSLQDLIQVYKNYVILEDKNTVYKSADELAKKYAPGTFDDIKRVSLICLDSDGKEIGIKFGLTLGMSLKTDNLKEALKVWKIEIYSGMTMYRDPKQTDIIILSPSFSEEFATPGKGEEDDWDPFVSDPNGRYYHFKSKVGEGDSQWDGIFYDEVFTATSALAQQGNTRYDAKNLLNNLPEGGDRLITWCEGVDGHGIGERITMSIRIKPLFPHRENEVCITDLMIVNGFARNATAWKNNARVKTLRLYVGDTHWCDLELKDLITPQVFELPGYLRIYPVVSGKIIPAYGKFLRAPFHSREEWQKIPTYQTDLIFEILEVYPGDRYEDTCITGIAVDVIGGVY